MPASNVSATAPIATAANFGMCSPCGFLPVYVKGTKSGESVSCFTLRWDNFGLLQACYRLEMSRPARVNSNQAKGRSDESAPPAPLPKCPHTRKEKISDSDDEIAAQVKTTVSHPSPNACGL
jgi:hypothetical protein